MILTALSINDTVTYLSTAQIMSVVDNVLELVRSHSGQDVCRVVSYALTVTTIDSEGQLHAHVLTPTDQTLEELLTLREQCQELLPKG